MKDENLKVGMWCTGTTSFCADIGKIEEIKRSTGSRKDLIYKIGNYWYFADNIKRYWEKELEELIGKGNEYVFIRPALITFNKEKYLVESIEFKENFLAKGRDFSLRLYMLRPSSLKSLYNIIVNELSEGKDKEDSYWSNWYWNKGGRNKVIKQEEDKECK